MGKSDSDSDSSISSASSARSYGSNKVKKDKKDKGHKDKDKKDKKDKDGKDKKDKDGKDKKGKDKKDKDGKDKKDKDDKHKDKKDKDSKDKSDKPSFPQAGLSNISHPSSSSSGLVSVPAFNPNFPGAGGGSSPPAAAPSAPPPGYTGLPSTAPPSGYRVPLVTNEPFPSNPQEVGPPVTQDADGSPIFLGSAIFENTVQPCKIGPHLSPPAQVAYGGSEIGHQGRYDLLPFLPNEMEWVPTSQGRIPPGRRPVEGGYEENGAKLYHALAHVNGIQVPGKTGEHLGGANVGLGGQEHAVTHDYRILVWR